MKFAIVGLGGWVNYEHLPELNELGFKVDYCVDIDEKRVLRISHRKQYVRVLRKNYKPIQFLNGCASNIIIFELK